MFIPDGSKLAAVDTMQELWTGKVPERPCPVISKFGLLTSNEVKAGEIVKAAVEAADPNGDKLKYEWTLDSEFHSYSVQSGNAQAAPSHPDAIVKNGELEAVFKMPEAKGVYRIYCYVRNQHGGGRARQPTGLRHGRQLARELNPCINNLLPLVRCARAAAAGARGWIGEPLRPDDFGIMWKHLAWKIARRIFPTRSDSPRLYDRTDFGGEIVSFRRSK